MADTAAESDVGVAEADVLDYPSMIAASPETAVAEASQDQTVLEESVTTVRSRPASRPISGTTKKGANRYPTNQQIVAEAQKLWEQNNDLIAKKTPAASGPVDAETRAANLASVLAAAVAARERSAKGRSPTGSRAGSPARRDRKTPTSSRASSPSRRSHGSPTDSRAASPTARQSPVDASGTIAEDPSTPPLRQHPVHSEATTQDSASKVAFSVEPASSNVTWAPGLAKDETFLPRQQFAQPTPPPPQRMPIPLGPISRSRSSPSVTASQPSSIGPHTGSKGSSSSSSGQPGHPPRFRYAGALGKRAHDPGKIYSEDGSFRLRGVSSLSDVHRYTAGVKPHSRKHWEVREAYKLMRAEQHAALASQTWGALHSFVASDKPFDKWHSSPKARATHKLRP